MQLPSLIFLSATLCMVSAWKCGIGPISGAVSYAIAFPADVPGINNCCIEHDALVDGLHVAREEADRVFCHCLGNNGNWYVSNIVKPLFCSTVQMYTKWMEKQIAKETIGQFITDFRFRRVR